MKTRKRSSTLNYDFDNEDAEMMSAIASPDDQLDDDSYTAAPAQHSNKRARRTAPSAGAKKSSQQHASQTDAKKTSSSSNLDGFAPNRGDAADTLIDEFDNGSSNNGTKANQQKDDGCSLPADQLDGNGDLVNEEPSAAAVDDIAGSSTDDEKGFASCDEDDDDDGANNDDDNDIGNDDSVLRDGQVPTWSQLFRCHRRLKKKLNALGWIDKYVKGINGPSAAAMVLNNDNMNSCSTAESVPTMPDSFCAATSISPARFETEDDFENFLNTTVDATLVGNYKSQDSSWHLIRDARSKLVELNDACFKQHLADQVKPQRKVSKV